jgi:hypothetical protein
MFISKILDIPLFHDVPNDDYLPRSPGLPEIAVEKAENLLEELMEERNRETTDSSPACSYYFNY